MAARTTGLSREMIIHPGETLAEVLSDRDLTQTCLAERTGVSPAFVSNVVNGKKGISASFARKLEYATGVPAHFWNNLQALYDDEIAKYEEQNNLSAKERQIVKRLRPVSKYMLQKNIRTETQTIDDAVMWFRRWFCVSNLEYIDKMTVDWAARKSRKVSTDPYILFAWLQLCRELAERDDKPGNALNKELLRENLNAVKKVMFLPAHMIEEALSGIFSSCGIIFKVIEHFRGAPVQGAVFRLKTGNLALFLTLRGAFADIFWFTLMHEIGHILHGDIDHRRGAIIDVEDQIRDDCERRADEFARQALVDRAAYRRFLDAGMITLKSIVDFASEQNVQPYIIVGRLQRDGIISYTAFRELKIRYKWDKSPNSNMICCLDDD